MKRALVFLATLMMAACAPALSVQHTSAPTTITTGMANGGPMSFLFDEQPAEKIEVSCPVEGRCVPHYRLAEDINESSVQKAISWVEAANEAGAEELLLELNTPGGSVPDGFELAKAIENSAAPVSCVVDGDAASMGAYILQSCSKRYMTKRSKIMFHEPSLGGTFRGTPNQWQAYADMLKAEREAIAEHCQHRLKISMKEYRAKTDGGLMWWLNWGEGMKVAAVDAIAVSVKDLHEKLLK